MQPPEGMVVVPKGLFLYSETRESKFIPYDYWIDVYPVTNQLFREFIDADGYHTKKYWSKEGLKWKATGKIVQPLLWDDPQWNKPSHPVVAVSYYEAEAYTKFMEKRLPTEKEWEKAARGTEGREYPWGDEFDKNKCNSKESGIDETSPVTTFPDGQSPYGCCDMAGNVWEWCASWYDAWEKAKRVVRGGSWTDGAKDLRASLWNWFWPASRNAVVGFRCVKDVK